VTDQCKLEARAEGEKKGGNGDPDAVDEILIVDYVMLDFAEYSSPPQKRGQRGSGEEPGLSG
jgi:hypothetical protein